MLIQSTVIKYINISAIYCDYIYSFAKVVMKKSHKLGYRRISGKAGCDRCLTKMSLAQINYACILTC